jgi:hypothetical protein
MPVNFGKYHPPHPLGRSSKRLFSTHFRALGWPYRIFPACFTEEEISLHEENSPCLCISNLQRPKTLASDSYEGTPERPPGRTLIKDRLVTVTLLRPQLLCYFDGMSSFH